MNGVTQSPVTGKRISLSEMQNMFSALLVSDKSSLKNEDSHDLFGKLVADKLRQMDKSTAVLAEKIINEILYEALLGNLTPSSALTFIPHQKNL